mmetsp:Transcript_34931/g.42729  ORF Transcript_34931/g.42729 Transcript_34931/m.42729 type:complete len:105 (+) Transcript_34931:1454-1768(+)
MNRRIDEVAVVRGAHRVDRDRAARHDGVITMMNMVVVVLAGEDVLMMRRDVGVGAMTEVREVEVVVPVVNVGSDFDQMIVVMEVEVEGEKQRRHNLSDVGMLYI